CRSRRSALGRRMEDTMSATGMGRRLWTTIGLGIIGFGLLPAALHAQAVKGGLLGNLTDQSGLALPGATVTITETNTNISYSAVANESGYYIFSNLKDGVY